MRVHIIALVFRLFRGSIDGRQFRNHQPFRYQPCGGRLPARRYPRDPRSRICIPASREEGKIMTTHCALITARGNNESLPDKNLIPILGKPSLQYAVEAARGAARIGAVYLSTE